MPRLGVAGVALVALLVLSACEKSETSTSPERPLRLKSITIVMVQDANENWPAQVGLARIRDADKLPMLLAMSAKAWFAKEGEAFRAAHPDGVYDVWEIVPGSDPIGPEQATVDGNVAGVLFCDIRSAPPASRLETSGHISISITDDGCAVAGGSPAKKPSAIGKLLQKLNVW